MNTRGQKQPDLETYVIRIYRRSVGERSAAVSGTVEQIPGGGLSTFNSLHQLSAILDLPARRPAASRKNAQESQNVWPEKRHDKPLSDPGHTNREGK